MKKILIGVFSILLFLPLFCVQGQTFNFDLGLQKEDISFSWQTGDLVSGEKVEASIVIHNYGNFDVSTRPVVLLNDQLLIEIPNILVKAVDKSRGVFFDFIAPDNDFRLTVQLTAMNPGDQNLLNNKVSVDYSVKSPPIVDTRLSVTEKSESELLPVNNLTVSNEEQSITITPPDYLSLNGEFVDSFDEVVEATDADVILQAGEVPSGLKIVARTLKWGVFDFSYKSNDLTIDEKTAQIKWDFGDGNIATANGVYEYQAPGAYYVKLKVVARDANTHTAVETVIVPFWSIYNIYFWGLVIFVVVVLLALFLILKKK